jgi:acetyl-CoA synthetase
MARPYKSYEEMREKFTWDDFTKKNLDWDPAKRFNFAHEAVDRHAKDPNKVALFYISPEGREEKYTYRELKHLSSKFANVLKNLGVGKGDRVARMLPRCPESYATFMGTWKIGAVDVPLYTAFGPEAVEQRVKGAGAKILVTDSENRGKVERIEGGLPGVDIVVVGGERGLGIRRGDVGFYHEMASATREFETVETKSEDLAIIQFTSGTTGPPKGAMVTHGSMICLLPYPRYCLGIQEDDVFWGFADPGWIYGLLTAGSGVLVMGGSLLVHGGRFDAKTWYEIMQRYEVNNFTAAPTAFRTVIAAGDDLPQQYRLKVRRLSSAGEALNPEASLWFEKHFGVPMSDHYGATEVGMTLGNYPFMKQKPGSMGKPCPGFDVAILDEAGNKLAPGQTGVIAVKRNKYLLAQGYWNDKEKWDARFLKGEWFNTGDLAATDEDGYFFYKGREDDIISSSGYRIGPAEVEGTLLEHPGVAEAAVVGKPDEQRGELVKAFVVLKAGFESSGDLSKELQNLVRNRYSKHAYPREIDFLPELPKTESGKVMRRELRKIA